LTLPDEAGTIVTTASAANPLTTGTAVASTSGTAIDFTGLPSWTKRITVMFNGVSTTGAAGGASSYVIIQIGSGSITTSGYNSTLGYTGTAAAGSSTITTTGFILMLPNNASTYSGAAVLTNMGSNTWVYTSTLARYNDYYVMLAGGSSPALGGSLDRVRITSGGGTDTFDAGSINILYE
jgi:hypothetical protein